MEFCGANVRIARVFRGDTQQSLAEKIAVSEGAIWQIEKGRKPSETLLDAIALTLGFEPEFFFEPLPDEFTEEDCNFRRSTSAAEKLRKRVLARGTLFAQLVRRVQQKVNLPKYTVPAIACTSDEEIELAAEECRRTWRLGTDTPIAHVGRVLENSGVMLTRLEGESTKIDAFSRKSAACDVSFVVLNDAKGSTSRARFDMAHELGHLVMHNDSPLQYAEREQQADRFASAFLLPRRAFAREFWTGGHLDWVRVFELKARWKVSAQAIVYRAYDLGLIDAVEFRRAYKTISARGWRKGEPEEPPPERPELFRTALQTLWERKKIGAADLAKELRWSLQTFTDVTGWHQGAPVDAPTGTLKLITSSTAPGSLS
ncbi:MAG TPA: XRE family transcriptional regulator [Gemmatimonadaceae bacterium]|nr:XRE family transcriptional regulator [Gemmatimonadaceae bacterium]